MLGECTLKSYTISRFQSQYKEASQFVNKQKDVKFITTQPFIHKLYTDPNNVVATPRKIKDIVILYANGFRYLVVDPQSYVSLSEPKNRFREPLDSYVTTIKKFVKPVKVYPHFSKEMLKRFVFDHNIHLKDSISFLRSNIEEKGSIYVYDLNECLPVLKNILNQYFHEMKTKGTHL